MPIGPSSGYSYGPNPGRSSSSDPKGRLQNQSQYQQQRYESQQGPLAQAMAQNYGYGSEANIGDYTDIMNQYRSIASGGGDSDGGGGGGGGGGGFSAEGMYTPFTVDYSDPFASYGGFQDFSNTGGYSAADMANLRARGVSPVRAAYANAEQNLQRGRSLQGGYSPNMAAAQVKMAREQGQSAADAIQNVEGGIINQRNQGKLAGLTGMSGIEGQRLNAQIDVGKYNAGARERAQGNNIQAAESAAGRGAASSAASAAENNANRFKALAGMTNLYGTTPGMAATFGNQAINIVGQGGQFGNQLYGNDINAQKAPGQFEQTMSRGKDIYNTAATVAAPIIDYFGRKKRQQTSGGGGYSSTGWDGGDDGQ